MHWIFLKYGIDYISEFDSWKYQLNPSHDYTHLQVNIVAWISKPAWQV